MADDVDEEERRGRPPGRLDCTKGSPLVSSLMYISILLSHDNVQESHTPSSAKLRWRTPYVREMVVTRFQ